MKGLQGMIIAAALGILGGLCNWFYISQQARDYQRVSFIGIDPVAQINPGDQFQEDHFQRVDIPSQNVGNLNQFGVLWKDRNTVLNMPSNRSYLGGELLLRQDLKTPAQRDLSQRLGENEGLRWVPVDQRAFVPQLLNPGDRVSFVVPQIGAQQRNSQQRVRGVVSGATQIIGPFEVLALGTRRGRREPLKSRGASSGKESVIGIRVHIEDGRLDTKSAQLFEILRLTNNPDVQVMLHSARLKKES